jgi:hypothetical protein
VQLVKQGGIVDRPTQLSEVEADVPEAELTDSIHWQAVDESRAFG